MLYKGKNLFKRPYNHGLQVCNVDNFQESHRPPTLRENMVAAKNEECNSAMPGVEQGSAVAQPSADTPGNCTCRYLL